MHRALKDLGVVAPFTDVTQEMYRWGRGHFHEVSPLLSKQRARIVLSTVCYDVHMGTPHLLFANKLQKEANALHSTWGNTCCRKGQCTIALAKSGMNLSSLLHEIAHHLNEYVEGAEPHGPQFVAIYLHLIEKYGEDMVPYVGPARRAAVARGLL